MSTLVNAIENRLALLTIASAYRPMADGSLHRVADITPWQTADPWFWPTVYSFVMCPPDVTDAPQPPRRPPLTPERTGGVIADTSTWTTIWETLEDGRRMIVGRYPSFVQLWGGVIDEFPDTISVQSFDAFQDALASGASCREAVRRHLLPAEQQHPSGLTTSGPLQPKLGIIGPPAGPEVPTGPGTPGGPTGPPDRRYVDEQGRDPRQPRPHGAPMTCWERISCIGLDIEKKAVTATIEILQTSGYGGPLCDSTSFESVGFWLIEPSHAENDPQDWSQSPNPNRNSGNPFDPCGGAVRFLGSAKVNVADIARAEGMRVECSNPALRYNPAPLHYTVTLALRDEDLDLMRFCSDSPRLPALHCVLRWNVNVRNSNYGGAGVLFGDAHTCVVQYPTRHSVPRNRYIPSVGILLDDCDSVLLSPFIRQGIDRLAVQPTEQLVDAAKQHGFIRFILISSKEQRNLARLIPLEDLSIGLRSREWSFNELESQNSIIPFESEIPPTGSWLLCTISSDNSHKWDPSRDLLLTGNISSDSIFIVGVASTFLDGKLEMAGPLDLGPIDFDFRLFSSNSDLRNFPPCLTDTPSIRLGHTPDGNVLVFFPILAGEAPVSSSYRSVNDSDSIVFIIPANGSGNVQRDWHDYESLVRQFVLQGFIVAFQLRKATGSDYGLIDSLPAMLKAVLSAFPQVRDPTLFFFGHSQGGNQVAFLLSDATAISSVRFRIAGGILLAPTIHSGDMQVMHAPILTFWGALDSDIRFINLRCDDKSWTDWTLSPLWYYTNTVGPFSAFIFAAGATHFRWIDSIVRQDDYYKVRGISENYDIERALIMDGPDETVAPYREHFAILLSYSTYFVRACLLNELSLLEPICTPYFYPPDVFDLQRSLHVREGMKVYYSGPDNDNLNSFGQLDNYHYKGVGVRRTIVGQNRRSTTTASAVYHDASSVVQDMCAAINVDVIVAEGRHVEMLFELAPSLSVLSSELLSLEFVVLGTSGKLYTGSYKVVVSLKLDDGKEYEIDLDRADVQLSDLRLTKLNRLLESPGVDSELMLALGEVLLLQSFRMRLDWFTAECFARHRTYQGSAVQPRPDTGSQLSILSLASIRVTCVSDDASELIFGVSSLKLITAPTQLHAA